MTGPNVYAQIYCGYDDVSTSLPAIQFNSFCGSSSLSDYIPASGESVKEIDLVINVMQKESPGNPENFTNSTLHIAAIKTMLFDHFIEDHNKFPIRLLEKNVSDGIEIPNHPYIQDSKIQPRIIEINFIQDNQGHNNDNSPCGDYNYNLYRGGDDKSDVALMVYLVEDIILSDTSGPYLWSVGGCGQTGYIIMHGLFQSYNDHQGNADSVYLPHIMYIRELMTHELGHSLGLEHTFDGGCGSQLDDVIPCPGYDGGCYPYISDINKPDCNNNIMSYATVRRYLSPKQIGLMHRTLTRTSSARFVRPNSNSPTSDIYIAQDETWDTDRFATGDIYVETGSTLTVSCVLFMPPKARIIVKRGARLIVECGQITTNRHPFNSLQKYADGDYWGGIEVWGNTEVEHDVTMRSPLYELQETDPGIVLLDNAEISNAKPGIATVQRGGYNVNHNSAFCSELPGFTICDSIPCYVELKQDYLVADSLYNKDPSDEYNRDRIIKMSSRFESLRKVIKRLQTEKDYTSFLTLINDEDHDLGRKAKLWYYIDQELWEDARDYLDLLDIRNASDQAFIDAQEINLNRLEYGLDYTLSASEIERLWEIAHTILPDRSFARGLLVYMLDTIFEPQFPHDSIINRQSNLEEITQEITSQPDFLLLPNPYTDHLIVAVNGIDLQICDVTMYVSTLQGQIIHEQQLDSPQTNIFLDNHLSGIFIVSFVDCNNKKWVKKLVKI